MSCDSNCRCVAGASRRNGIGRTISKVGFYAGVGALAGIAAVSGYRGLRAWQNTKSMGTMFKSAMDSLSPAQSLFEQGMAATDLHLRLGLITRAQSLVNEIQLPAAPEAAAYLRQLKSGIETAVSSVTITDVAQRGVIERAAKAQVAEATQGFSRAVQQAQTVARRTAESNTAAAVAAGIPVAVMPLLARVAPRYAEAARRADEQYRAKRGRASAVAAQSPRSQPEDAQAASSSTNWSSYRGMTFPSSAYLLRYAVGAAGSGGQPKPFQMDGDDYIGISGPFGTITAKPSAKSGAKYFAITAIVPGVTEGCDFHLGERLGAIKALWDKRGYEGIRELEEAIQEGVEEGHDLGEIEIFTR